MRDINGNLSAGRDINIFENSEQYKPLDQCSLQELQQERPKRQKRLKQRRQQRWARAPKWTALPFFGLLIGVYCTGYLLQTEDVITLESIWWILQSLSNRYHPLIIPIIFLTYLLLFWVFPVRHIFDLLFIDDAVMKSHRNAIHQIDFLLAERG